MAWTAYRRVPDAGACQFCLILATRGAVYSSRESAGEAKKYHRRCKCTPEAETSIDARFDVRIPPEDANRTVSMWNRPRELGGRRYTYDLRNYRNRQVKPPPAAKAPDLVTKVPGQWTSRFDDDVLEFLAQTTDRESVGWKRAKLLVEQYEARTNGIDVVLVPKGKSGTVSAAYAKRLEKMQAVMDDVLPRIPRWRRYDANGNPRPYIVFVDSKYFRRADVKDARGFTYVGSDAVFMNPKTLDLGVSPGRKGWSMPAAGQVDRARYTFAHEVGHTTDLPSSKATEAIYEEFKDSEQLSDYGKTKAVEAYAEAFAEWVWGDKTNPVVAAYAERFGWAGKDAVGFFGRGHKATRVIGLR